MTSWRCWSRTNMTPADVTLFETAHHPPFGCCGRQITQQTARLSPGWDWFIGLTWCTSGKGAAPLFQQRSYCVHTELDSACRTLQTVLQRIYILIMYRNLWWSYVHLWYNFWPLLRKRKHWIKDLLLFSQCSALGLWPDVAAFYFLKLFICRHTAFVFDHIGQKASSAILPLDKVEVQLPFLAICQNK